ncbi:unnamed protein product [Malus baccata var. baccata]
MAPPSLVANGGAAGVESIPAPVTGRFASVYSEVQVSRIDHALPLPSVLRNPFKVVDGPASSAAGNPEEIVKLFPNVFGQPSARAKRFRFGSTGAEAEDRCRFIWRSSARRTQCDFWNFRLI